MISVQLPAAPANYEPEVRIPGNAFLATNPHPTKDEFDQHRYWKEIHEYLHDQLRGICMYCSTFTPRGPSGRWISSSSIDHYVPKSVPDHTQAYEWNNFRLCRAGLNNLKANYRDVLDPCAIQNRWFQLSFTNFKLHPKADLDAALQGQVWDSIARLQLNVDERYLNERTSAIYLYADNQMPFANLSKFYPFIASEMTAQDFDQVHLPRFQRALANPKIRPNLVTLGYI